MVSIFISYRREDSKPFCDRITGSLRNTFESSKIYRDIESPTGVDYRRSIDDALNQSSVVLAIIGPQWATVQDPDGQPRLADPADLVRIEIESALLRRIPILPVLIQDTRMPKASEVPPSLSQLVYIQAHRVREDPDYYGDMEAVIKGINYFVPITPDGGVVKTGLPGQALRILFVIGAVIMMIIGLAWTVLGIENLISVWTGFLTSLILVKNYDYSETLNNTFGLGFIYLLGSAVLVGAIFLLRVAMRTALRR